MIDDPKIKQDDQDPPTTEDPTTQGSAGGTATYGDVETEDENMDVDLEEEEVVEDTDTAKTEVEEK